MAIFNLFKKKKPEKKEVKKPVVKKPRKKAPAVKKPQAAKPQAKLKPKKTSITAYRVLLGPQVTEKASDLTNSNQYVFKVYKDSNKPEIKKTIEDIYGVDVLSVHIVNIPAKKRRLGRTEGWRKPYKKAIVRLKEGQKIEILPR